MPVQGHSVFSTGPAVPAILVKMGYGDFMEKGGSVSMLAAGSLALPHQPCQGHRASMRRIASPAVSSRAHRDVQAFCEALEKGNRSSAN